MLSLSTKSCSVTVNAVEQKIYLVTHPVLFSQAQATRVVPFEEIEQVYLNFWEESYTIQREDEYSHHDEPRIWRRWAIELTLRDGQVVTIGEETTDHRAGETSAPARQRAYWKPLAASVSKLIGKPLTAMPPVRDAPRTFVEAIDQIVQRRLKQSGSNLSVNIHSTKELGLEIVVNGKTYSGVNEIEDEAARSLIQASIDEWQGSHKGRVVPNRQWCKPFGGNQEKISRARVTTMKDDLMYEERVTSNRTELLFIATTIVFFLLYYWRVSTGAQDFLVVVFLCLSGFFLFYSLNYRVLIIRLKRQFLKLTFGIFTWSIPLDNIQACRIDDLSEFMKMGGAGIHFMLVRKRYRASFNFLEHPRVVIEFKRKAGLVRDLSFSTCHPNDILRLVQEGISARNTA